LLLLFFVNNDLLNEVLLEKEKFVDDVIFFLFKVLISFLLFNVLLNFTSNIKSLNVKAIFKLLLSNLLKFLFLLRMLEKEIEKEKEI
jgi:hypothetical protein